MRHTHSLLSEGAVWVLGCTVALGAMVTIPLLRHAAENSRHIEELFSRVESQAHQLHALESQAMAQQALNQDLLGSAQELRDQLQQGLLTARDLGALQEKTERVSRCSERYLAAMDEELQLLAGGYLAQARRVDAERVEPSFAALQGAIAEASAFHHDQAYRVLWTADLGSAAALMITAVALGLTFFVVARARHATRVAAAEHAVLRRSEKRFRSLVQNAADVILLLERRGTLRYVSDSAPRVLGISPQEMIGTPLLDFVHPADRVQVETFLHACLQDAELTASVQFRPHHQERRYLEAVGNNRLTDPSVGGLVLNCRDITERKQAEAALRESEERYRSLFENANDTIVTFTLDGTVTSVNRGLEAILGWTRAEVVGRHFRTFVAPASVALGEERIRRFLAGERMPSIFEAEHVTKDGRVVPVEACTQVIRAADGTPVGFQGIYRDMSARKALEQQRADFLAMLSHDLRNPLGVILGYTEMLLETDEGPGGAGAADLLGRIRTSALTAHALVTNYLNLLRIEAGQLTLAKRPLPLNELLLRVGQQYETEARRRALTLDYHLQPDLPLIAADAVALERVFGNLVHNALKFTPKGGQVRISSARREGAVLAAVADTGPGLAAEEIPLLFEKYRKVGSTTPQHGTGLGLFIAQTVVHAHGGRITVESIPGAGTCFSVVLPVRTAAGRAENGKEDDLG